MIRRTIGDGAEAQEVFEKAGEVCGVHFRRVPCVRYVVTLFLLYQLALQHNA